MEDGPKWIQDESDLQQQSLKEQLDNLETGWNDLHILWENRKKLLIQALNNQVWLKHQVLGLIPHTVKYIYIYIYIYIYKNNVQ